MNDEFERIIKEHGSARNVVLPGDTLLIDGVDGLNGLYAIIASVSKVDRDTATLSVRETMYRSGVKLPTSMKELEVKTSYFNRSFSQRVSDIAAVIDAIRDQLT